MSKYKDIFSNLIVTCFFVGRIKYAPGTFGSLLAFPINYYIAISVMESRYLLPLDIETDFIKEFITVLAFLTLSSSILFVIGVVSSNYYMKKTGRHDPSEIVIDEVVGQMLTSTLTLLSVVFVYASEFGSYFHKGFLDFMCYFLMPFILFRACDIIKPWPIGWMDKKIKGGIGVMLDDVAAAILAATLQYAIIFAFV